MAPSIAVRLVGALALFVLSYSLGCTALATIAIAAPAPPWLAFIPTMSDKSWFPRPPRRTTLEA